MSDRSRGFVPDSVPGGDADPEAFWEARYGERDRIWSGRVNPVLAEVAEALPPGRALDVGSGEGGDSVWLASRGWAVTAVDISPTALARTAEAARDAGVGDRVRTLRLDLARELPPGRFELVSAQFFQSPLELPRDEVLRRLAELLEPGGRFLLVDHGTVPPWSAHRHEHDDADGHGRHGPATLAETLSALALPPAEFEIEEAIERARTVTHPDGGQEAEIVDHVVLARRR